MPYTARRKYARKRRPRRNAAGLATRPRMMGKGNASKRYHGVDTRVFWFKQNGVIESLPAQQTPQFRQFQTGLLATSPPVSFNHCRGLFDQYKILGMKLRLFPANVGKESMDLTSQLSVNNFVRGNHCLWIDQRWDPNSISPTTIAEVISTASARLINPRRPYSVSLWRPKGKPNWGSCKDIVQSPDLWNGVINYLLTDCTVTVPNGPPQVFYYYTLQWKVIFRGRCED